MAAMFARSLKLHGVGTAAFRAPLVKARPMQTRLLATVQNSIPRDMPHARPRATPVSSDPATFTIHDGPMFHGKSFGAKASISGEAVFTTSLVGYPESLTDPSYRAQVCPDSAENQSHH